MENVRVGYSHNFQRRPTWYLNRDVSYKFVRKHDKKRVAWHDRGLEKNAEMRVLSSHDVPIVSSHRRWRRREGKEPKWDALQKPR